MTIKKGKNAVSIELSTKTVLQLGGVAAVARLFGIKSQSVSQWLRLGALPDARSKVLEVLCPDIFPPRETLRGATAHDVAVLGVQRPAVTDWARSLSQRVPGSALLPRIHILYPGIDIAKPKKEKKHANQA